ncbi:MAG TPA: DEAD/DEAH box helicase [Acidimicrobiales bacterium]|nr:DEAD/DEAH box helicase [Acidimicrobiales bacterium]
MTTDPLAAFHPAVAEWFRRRFPAGPTLAQASGWESIAGGSDTLVAAPTGSGKTLAAFLVAIDRCVRADETGERGRRTSVVYVSPLKALTVDVRENLERPLAEIAEIAAALGSRTPSIRVAVRNGDTPAAARAAMLRDPPDILVTTPESLYLLVTARRGRELLGDVRTVVVDEIHALARDKRGAHLALTLERLDRCVAAAGSGRPRPTRIGLSATQRPIATVARLLVGAGEGRDEPDGSPRCRIVDVGHRRPLDVSVARTSGELGAVTTTDQLGDVVEDLARAIERHRTTLVFVNTRRMAERIAHMLGEHLGEDAVCAHHGSLSSARRADVESRLRAGDLRGVVATASLELGIDVGPVDLVCQIGSPRSIATFLQRVGRADHRVDGVPKGRIYPLTRDELVECVALLAAVRDGSLDAVVPPVAPLDILAQQLVAECAAAGDDGICEDELLGLVRRAAPYSGLADETFAEVLDLASDGVTTGRGQRGAYLHRDRVNRVVRARRGARLTASTSGGAIPELADYRVVLEPDEVVVGSVNEDWAVEAMAGDVFLLGTASWRIRRVEQGTVRVVDAHGAAPTLPFWLGEAPARTDELADHVSAVRSVVDAELGRGGRAAAARAIVELAGVDVGCADELVAYLATARTELGRLPTKTDLVLERFFDDAGGMQLVVHSPFGARVNRGLGLALRKRFCVSFDFELQAAASDDAIVISLGPQHSFPLEDVTRFLAPGTVRDVLVQAVLPTPIFGSRWRWNLSRSLVSPRYRGSRHLPPAIQRMEADDLMAAIFPALAACQENVSGPIEVPDHPIVRQTLRDCFTEAIDLDGLVGLVAAIRSGEVRAHCLDTVEPSVLAHEILNGRPYTFLDDAPLEERRSRAVPLRRGIPIEARDLSRLDPAAVEEVRNEVAAAPRSADELHELLVSLVLTWPDLRWTETFRALVAAGRAMEVVSPALAPPATGTGAPTGGAGPVGRAGGRAWCATERRREVELLVPDATFTPDRPLPASLAPPRVLDAPDALVLAVRGQLERSGPIRIGALGALVPGAAPGELRTALATCEAAGGVLRMPEDLWCAKHLVARIHARSRRRERAQHPPVGGRDLMRFLLDWQHVLPATRLAGVAGLAAVVAQLQGVEAPVASWEESVLPARVSGYQAHLLDELCAHGEVGWARPGLRVPDPPDAAPRRAGATPSRATPVTIARREDLAWLLAAARGDSVPVPPGSGAAAEVLEALERRGALFFADLCESTGRLPVEVAEALWDGVARGLVTSDGFRAVRALLAGRYRSSDSHPARARWPAAGTRLEARRAARPAGARAHVPPALAGGRWSLLPASAPADFAPDELAEAVALQLLTRWGVVFRELATRETLAVAWRDVLYALRRLEARGVARGGRFVAGAAGEQYGLPDAIDALRRVARRDPDGVTVRLAAADPLNLTGLFLPGPRIPAVRGRVLLVRDGDVVGEQEPGGARRPSGAAAS